MEKVFFSNPILPLTDRVRTFSKGSVPIKETVPFLASEELRMSSVENHLNALRAKHNDLENQIAELEAHPSVDTLEVTRLKKEKLHLKEEIAKLEDGETVH